MRLTKKRAIEITIELWTWLAKSGAAWKWSWSGWKVYGKMIFNCPLCEYQYRRRKEWPDPAECLRCPYYAKYGRCTDKGTPFSQWATSINKADRKEYAAKFLEQLKQL